jgi:hypothetical protein
MRQDAHTGVQARVTNDTVGSETDPASVTMQIEKEVSTAFVQIDRT